MLLVIVITANLNGRKIKTNESFRLRTVGNRPTESESAS